MSKLKKLLIALLLPISLYAQESSFSSRLIWSKGIEIGVHSLKETNTIMQTKSYEGFIVGLNFNFRYNIIEKNTDKSFSIELGNGISGSLGYNYFWRPSQYWPKEKEATGYFGYTFPIYFSLNIGNGSTFTSEKEKGYGIAIGLENSFNLVSDDYTENGVYGNFTSIPTLKFTYRKWSESKKHSFTQGENISILKERVFKIGVGPSYDYLSDDGVSFFNTSSGYNIKFLRSFYISYSFNILPSY